MMWPIAWSDSAVASVAAPSQKLTEWIQHQQ
jgi:hypothetical protein